MFCAPLGGYDADGDFRVILAGVSAVVEATLDHSRRFPIERGSGVDGEHGEDAFSDDEHIHR